MFFTLLFSCCVCEFLKFIKWADLNILAGQFWPRAICLTLIVTVPIILSASDILVVMRMLSDQLFFVITNQIKYLSGDPAVKTHSCCLLQKHYFNYKSRVLVWLCL